LDDVSLYAKVALEFDEVNAAYSGTVSMWVRPFAAVAAGLIADRTRVSQLTAASFLLLAIGAGVIASGMLQTGMIVGFFIVIVGTSVAVYALRGLYFAIMQEGEIPFEYTGTVVGIVSMVGYTPDIFMGPLMGKLLDQSPGVLGHQHVFAVISGFSLIGCAAALMFQKLAKSRL
jgi:MFS family permease